MSHLMMIGLFVGYLVVVVGVVLRRCMKTV